MVKDEIVARVKSLGLPLNSYVVFGSCPMAAAGIREAKDIDLYVTDDVLKDLSKKGWKKIHKGPKDEPYTLDIFEAHANWDFSPYAPTLDYLLESAMIIDGVSFASLEEVRRWKAASGGPKHEADIKLIDKYLAKEGV